MKSIVIIIPVFKQAAHLERALASVAGQLRPGDTVIVIDDNGTELESQRSDSECIEEVVTQIERHNVPGIAAVKLIKNGSNRGVSYSRNVAAAAAQESAWIKFLDADDVLAPFALETFRREEIEEDMHIISGSLVQVIEGKVGSTIKPDIGQILFHNPTLVSNTFIRRSAFIEAGGFDERLQFEEDWELWLKMEKRFGIGAFAVMDFPVCYYWISELERASKVRDHTIEVPDSCKPASSWFGDPGDPNTEIQIPMKRIDVREYFKNKYNTKSK